MTKLQTAYVCLDCDEVFDMSKEPKCTACGSRFFWPIENFINKQVFGWLKTGSEEKEDAI